MMTEEAIYKRVVEVLVEKLELEATEIRPESTLTDDLGASSLELIDMVMEFEKETGITIDPQKLYEIKTVQDIARLLHQQQTKTDSGSAAHQS